MSPKIIGLLYRAKQNNFSNNKSKEQLASLLFKAPPITENTDSNNVKSGSQDKASKLK